MNTPAITYKQVAEPAPILTYLQERASTNNEEPRDNMPQYENAISGGDQVVIDEVFLDIPMTETGL